MVKRQGQKYEFRQVGGRCSQNSEFLQGNSCFDIGLRSFKTFEPWVGGSYLQSVLSVIGFLSVCVSIHLPISCLTKSLKEIGPCLLAKLPCPFLKSIHEVQQEEEPSEESVWDYSSREAVQTLAPLLTGNFLPQWKGKELRAGALTPLLPSFHVLGWYHRLELGRLWKWRAFGQIHRFSQALRARCHSIQTHLFLTNELWVSAERKG